MTQLKKDVELLSSLNVMDYSLLLGIHYVSRGNAENIRETTLSVYQPRTGLTRSLSRTLSKRKAYEALLNTEPRRLSSTGAGMVLPSEEFLERKRGLFTSEEGGFYATNEQDQPTGDIIYYFGVIDILTTVWPPLFRQIKGSWNSTDSRNILKRSSNPFPIHVTNSRPFRL